MIFPLGKLQNPLKHKEKHVLGFCLVKALTGFTEKVILHPPGCHWAIWVVWVSVALGSLLSGSFVLYGALSTSAAGNILVPVRRLLLRKMLCLCHTHHCCDLIHITEASPWGSLGTKWTKEILEPCGQGTLLSVRHSGCRTTLERAGSKPPAHSEMLCWQHLSNSCFMLLLHSAVC